MTHTDGTDDHSTAAAARAVFTAYGIDGAELHPIRTTNNAVFEVRGNAPAAHTGVSPAGRWVLRVHRPRYRSANHTRSELTFLLHVAVALTGSSIRVPAPVSTLSGDLVAELELADASERASRHCSLLTWVKGQSLRRPGRGFGPRAARLAGEALGRLHDAAETFTPPAGFDLPTWGAVELLTDASPYRPGRFRRLLGAADRALVDRVDAHTRRIFDALDNAPGSSGLIHADFILGNCLYARQREGWRVTVIDFDDLGWGHFLYDLAPLLGNLIDDRRYHDLGNEVIAGYLAVRPLPPTWQRDLPWLMAARHVAAFAWVVGIHRTTGGGPPLDRHLAARMAMLRDCVRLATS